MEPPATTFVQSQLSWKQALPFVLGAALSFHLAYSIPACGFLIVVYLWCIFQLTRLKTGRLAFYFGLATGLLCGAPQLNFFWTIFGPAAIALWCVFAFWIALFVSVSRATRLHFGKIVGLLLIPFIWTGLEYFRSELYYLRFSWLNAGYVFAQNSAWLPLHLLGVYGIGFLLMAAIAAFEFLNRKKQLIANISFVAVLAVAVNAPKINSSPSFVGTNDLQVAGVQLEFPSEQQLLWDLNKLIQKYPDAQLLVMSEYTVNGPLPEKVKQWCQKNHRYLIIGAKDPVSDSDYFNTAFVVAPAGEIIFKQAKSVPIQFFKDGLPAKEQKLWNSPWGKIGLCICYDLSYTHVTDQLIRLGARAIIVPTMDVADWGKHQHALHARVAPTRATEYSVPIFRLASSGISQLIEANGNVLATAPMPGEDAMIAGPLRLARPGTLPLDRYLAPVAVAITGFVIAWLLFNSVRKPKPKAVNPAPA